MKNTFLASGITAIVLWIYTLIVIMDYETNTSHHPHMFLAYVFWLWIIVAIIFVIISAIIPEKKEGE